jgi:prophage tail gpP-like protein
MKFAPPFTLLVNGIEYAGWQSLRITRGLTRATSDFELSVSERWSLLGEPWQIKPGDACVIMTGAETLLTGWIDSYKPSYDATQHGVHLAGRSKTCDLVDCSAQVDGGQFRGLTVGEIAKQLAQPFNVEVNVINDGQPEAEVQVQQGETIFALVERLCRLQALLVTDDANGRLVITRAGSGRATTTLRHGSNILSASAELDQSKRYSECLVKAQRPGNSNKSNDDAIWSGVPQQPGQLAAAIRRFAEIDKIANPAERHWARRMAARDTGTRRGDPASLTQINGSIKDPEITRYRPLVIVAEAQADDGLAEKRAEWEMRRRKGEGTKANIIVNGFHQQDGSLWDVNLMVGVEAPWLALNRDLIIGDVTYTYDDNGERATLGLTLADAFLPEPARKAKDSASTAGAAAQSPWTDFGPATGVSG